MLLEKIMDSISQFFRITLAKIRTSSWLFKHPCPISGLFRSWKKKSKISSLFRTFQEQWEPWRSSTKCAPSHSRQSPILAASSANK